ncbi:hypothetical protein Ancab_012445 [Ancistrocladus abbreviatus]
MSRERTSKALCKQTQETSQVKQFQNQQQQLKGKEMQSSASTVTTSSSVGVGGQGAASKLPEPPKESFARRYKFVWPLLLTVNLAVGGEMMHIFLTI